MSKKLCMIRSENGVLSNFVNKNPVPTEDISI